MRVSDSLQMTSTKKLVASSDCLLGKKAVILPSLSNVNQWTDMMKTFHDLCHFYGLLWCPNPLPTPSFVVPTVQISISLLLESYAYYCKCIGRGCQVISWLQN